MLLIQVKISMLKHLRIQNIILVEQVEIHFEEGLNAITGETGSGKSAIMTGLSLVTGERLEASIIRKGCEKGIVEAVFNIDQHPLLPKLLEEAGLDHETKQDLLIRREILASGKSRVFINHQLAQVNLLRKIGTYLVQIVSQHANQSLFSSEQHRHILDLFGNLQTNLETYQHCFDHENRLKEKIEQFTQHQAQRCRQIDIYQNELKELQEAQLKEGEDDELFSEYTLLANSKELVDKVYEIMQNLSGERQSILTILNRQKTNLESLIRFDPILQETSQSFHNAIIELQEINHTLRQYQSRLHENPERLHLINDRLNLINRLKRKYGETIREIQYYEQQTFEKLKQLYEVDSQIEQLQDQLKQAKEATHLAAQQLTDRRIEVAKQLESSLTLQLHSLNMVKAEFKIELSLHKRSLSGQDKVEFFLLPNVGERWIALKDGASGGEISRVLLALQTLLAGKEHIPTLVFDEVDANIGGETATTVGDKLKEISKRHQVICITHFPQVASQASHHLQISKQEKEGRTVTLVRTLNTSARKQELARMVGKKI
jgi:DNA repair protein RecN (Recombination protein N)